MKVRVEEESVDYKENWLLQLVSMAFNVAKSAREELKSLKAELSKQLADFISDIQYPVDDSYLDVV